MAKGKSRSRKSKSAGSWKKRSGLRPSKEWRSFPELGVFTEVPGELGWYGASAQHDLGFFGRPKSPSNPLGFNKAREYTGGMAFPDAETVELINGQFRVVPVKHDNHLANAAKQRREEKRRDYIARKKAERAWVQAVETRIKQGAEVETAIEQVKRIKRLASERLPK